MYQLKRSPNIQRALRDAPSRVQIELARTILELQDDPYPPDAEELRDHYQGIWKIKVDGWRIFYEVYEDEKFVKIVGVKRRDRNTYTSIFSIFF